MIWTNNLYMFDIFKKKSKKSIINTIFGFYIHKSLYTYIIYI